MHWFDEIDLDPSSHPVSMGIRKLGDRPWLITDAKRDAELERKQALLRDHRAAVLHLTAECVEAATDVVQLVSDHGATGAPAPQDNADPLEAALHPLEAAALAVQEDLVLLDRRETGWHLNSAALCFPTRWTLADKVDHHISVVHGPVKDYDTRIASRVDRLFDQLTEKPVWRRNWFLMSNPALFQPFPTPIEHVESHDIEHGMWIRSERQTLRRLPSGWILFTIRIQQALLSELIDHHGRTDEFAHWLRDVPVQTSPQRHLFPEQRTALIDAFDHRQATGTWPKNDPQDR